MRVALYARVSSEAQEARGTIGSQIEALRERAATEEHEVVKECLDDGHSGARLDRPGLDTLRDSAVSGAFEAVLVLSPDRLSRNFAYQMVVIDELGRHGVEQIIELKLEDSELEALQASAAIYKDNIKQALS